MKVFIGILLVAIYACGCIEAADISSPAPGMLAWWPAQPPWWPSVWPQWPTRSSITTKSPSTCVNYMKYPYKSDCSKYQLCLSGTLFTLDCPLTLHFHDAIQDCDIPANAKCVVATTTTTEEDITTTQGKCIDYEKYPHEIKCDVFYLCLGGTLYEQYCPKPLHFNSKNQECDRPENANCEVATTTTTEAPCENFRFYPHPYECTKYYQCLGGQLYMLECPSHLAFNPDRQFCDYPDLANCPSVPPKCENFRKYPHEVDCNKYYYCIDQSLFLMNCNYEVLHFNAIIEDCDFAEKAMCEIEI